MNKFRSDFQSSESSDDELELEMYNENMNCSLYDSMHDTESVNSDDCKVAPPKKRKVLQTGKGTCTGEDNDEDDEKQMNDSGWERVKEKGDLPLSFTFKPSPLGTGSQVPQDVSRPLDFFKLYFTDELIDKIVRATNEHAKVKISEKQLAKKSTWHSWANVTREEFTAFIAVILNMGTMPLASISEYWTTKNNSRIPFYSEVFSRDRFRQIFWMLHLQGSSTPSSKARTGKANDFLQYIDSKFAEHFIPGQDICVNESVVKAKGKIAFIMYNPKKQTKRGVRIYVLLDGHTGYVCSMLPYFGSLTTQNLEYPDLPLSSRIPLSLVKKILRRAPQVEGYHLYTDRYFTSISLANELLKLKIHLTGMVMPNRKFLPTAVKKKPKFSTKSTTAYKKGNTLVLAWKSTRIVTLLSTRNTATLESVPKNTRSGCDKINEPKPTLATQFAKKMRAVDRVDKHAGTYCFLRKSLKWWRKLFFMGVEMCVINAYILHKLTRQKNDERPLTHLNFVKLLVDELVGSFRHQAPTRVQPSSSFVDIRLNNRLHVIRSGTKKDCAVCSDRKTPGKRRETRTYCDTCTRKPGLHIGDCFAKYHTLERPTGTRIPRNPLTYKELQH